jgi:phosphosulfolactate phosphohydrolase-like enzyme
MSKEKIVNLITGEETWRDYTDEENAAADAAEAKALLEKAERDADQAAKHAAKQAVLDKLGLSADEVAALLA